MTSFGAVLTQLLLWFLCSDARKTSGVKAAKSRYEVALRAKCFVAGEAQRLVVPAMPGSDDGRIHVAFFDTRPRPSADSMLRAAKLFNASNVQIHALLRSPMEIKGMRVHALTMPTHAECIYKGLARLAHGPGPHYLYKPLLHWIMPPDVRKLILVDHDTVLVRPVAELWAEFQRFGGALIGVGNEQSLLYQKKSNWELVGKNGGVQLLDLAAMRASSDYSEAIDRVASGEAGRYIGYLGDQTLYTFMAASHPRFFYNLPCQWNRQLSLHFGFKNASVHRCEERCGLVHANYAPLKCVANLMQQDPSCASWKRLQDEALTSKSCPRNLQPSARRMFMSSVRVFFSDCCVGTPLTQTSGALAQSKLAQMGGLR